MAERGGGRWDVGREWLEEDPEAWPVGRARPVSPGPPDQWVSPETPSARPPQPPPPYAPSGAYPPAQAMPQPPFVYPAAPPHQQGGYPPGVYPPNTYAPGTYPPGAYAPRGARVAGRGNVPQLDDELPSGGLIRPSRVLLLVALIISSGVVAYGLFIERGGLQIPISLVGLVMLGVSSALTALASLRGGLRASREGSLLRSVAVPIFGGLFALGAAGCFATAFFLGSLWVR